MPGTIPKDWLYATDVRRMWNKASNVQRREVVTALIERIEVHPPDPDWHRRRLDTRRIQVVKWRIPESALRV
jgi:hypothetical protein